MLSSFKRVPFFDYCGSLTPAELNRYVDALALIVDSIPSLSVKTLVVASGEDVETCEAAIDALCEFNSRTASITF